MNNNKIITAFLTLCIAFFATLIYANDNDVHIAIVSPYNEDPAGIKGVKLYLDQIKYQTHNGLNIIVDRYVDNNKKDQAADIAKRIAEESQAVVVIGHNYSSTSSAAGAIYAQAGIPAISYSATNPAVTKDNPWYFRTIFNDASQGSFLAYYAVHTLQQDKLTIISESDNYGDFLAGIFQEKAYDFGAKHVESYRLNMDEDLAPQYENITAQIAANKADAGLIFIAVQARDAVGLVKTLKDAGIKNTLMGPDTFYSRSFMQGFDQYPLEKNNPGHYSNGIYVTAPLVFDAANAEAQDLKHRYFKAYGEHADWASAYGYDTAKVIETVISNSQKAFNANTPISERRLTLRDALIEINSPQSAIKGTTGLNYFDKQGDAIKPVFIAVLHDREAVSAMTQYSDVPNIEEVATLNEQLESGNIVKMSDRHLYKKSVIFTGVKLHHIRKIDEQKNTSELDFTLWFRYQGTFEPSHIEFTNSLDSISLGKPYIETTSNNIHYQAFRIKGIFRNNFMDDIERRDQVNIGFSLRNTELDRNTVLYVSDIMGMGLTGDTPLAGHVKQQILAEDIEGWKIEEASIFERTINVDSLGLPEYINITDASVPYSQYHYVVNLKKTGFSLGDAIPDAYLELLTLISVITFFSAYLARFLLPSKLRKKQFFPRLRWLLLLFSSFLLLSSSELWLSQTVFPILDVHYQKWILQAYDLAWWIIPAILLVRAVDVFIWQTLQARTGRPVPGVIKSLLAFVIYTLALFAIVAFVYNEKLTGLLATSGLLAMIIGLAIQMNLSNIFSGIALNLEHPFRVGDWVKIGDHEGQVIDVNWRATRLLNRVKHEISIPNTPVADSPIVNYTNSDGATRQTLMVGVHPAHPIDKVKPLLISAAFKHPSVLRDPGPRCSFAGIKEGVALYRLIYSYSDYSLTFQVEDHIWTQMIQNFKQAGINYVPPMQRIEMNKAKPAPYQERLNDDFVNQASIFAGLPDTFCQELTENLVEKQFKAGQPILEKESKSHSLYIIRSGVAAIAKEDKNGISLEQQRLGIDDLINVETLYDKTPLNYTVQAVVDTTVLEITKPVLKALFKQYPDSYGIFDQNIRTISRQIESRKTNAKVTDHSKMANHFSWMEI